MDKDSSEGKLLSAGQSLSRSAGKRLGTVGRSPGKSLGRSAGKRLGRLVGKRPCWKKTIYCRSIWEKTRQASG